MTDTLSMKRLIVVITHLVRKDGWRGNYLRRT